MGSGLMGKVGCAWVGAWVGRELWGGCNVGVVGLHAFKGKQCLSFFCLMPKSNVVLRLSCPAGC